MSRTSTFAKGAMAAAAGLMALGAMAPAQAQPYGSSAYASGGYGNSYYDPCRRDTNNRGILGALLGAGIGATVGSQIAASGHRTDGSVLGGALGALGGAAVGSNTSACRSGGYAPPQPPPPQADNAYRGYGSGYGYAPPPGVHEYGRDDYAERIERDRYDGYAYGRRGERLRVAEDRPVGRDGCTLAESPIHMPDGRVQMRFVRVCMDSQGRYQVVD